MITHPEKVLFPDDGITKGELAAYYEAIAPVMLPHIRARPVTMERYPAGIGEKGFLQKDVSKGFPDWLERVEVPKKDGTVHHPLVTDTRSLLWLANQNTHHAARLDVARAGPVPPRHLRLRSRSVRTTSRTCCARPRSALRDLLDELGLPSWVKTSGSKGFHIVVPLDGKADYRRGRAVRARGRHAARRARSGAPHAGVQQGRPRRAHLRRHRPQRLQRDVRRGLRRARRSPARRCPRRARGRRSSAARSARRRSRCGRWPPASPRSATCGRTCEEGARSLRRAIEQMRQEASR